MNPYLKLLKMMDKIKEFFQDILNELRDISYNNSPERKEFAIERLEAHRQFMKNKRALSPYLHPETRDD